MPSTTPKPSEAILSQATPADALNVVAATLDIFAARLDALELRSEASTGWGDWSKPSREEEAALDREEWQPDPRDEAALAAYQEALQGCEDDLESKVLRAKIELTKDLLQPPVTLADNTGDASVITYADDGTAVVDLPPATAAQIDFRGELVGRIGLRDQYGDEVGEAAEDAFIKGGPLLLYYSDREYVNGLPADVKQAMVQDVEISSPKEAQQMGRDLLKENTDQSNDLDLAANRIQDLVDAGTVGNAP